VASLGDEIVVRDSKDPDGPMLHFSRSAWASFVSAIKDGEIENCK
jgi:Domain of unknown function (DUF397)